MTGCRRLAFHAPLAITDPQPWTPVNPSLVVRFHLKSFANSLYHAAQGPRAQNTLASDVRSYPVVQVVGGPLKYCWCYY